MHATGIFFNSLLYLVSKVFSLFLVVHVSVVVKLSKAFVNVPVVAIITVPDPLSAGFMTISMRFCNFLIATRPCLDRLSRITAGCEDMRSCCTTVYMNVSRAGSLPQGGVQDPLHLKGWLLASVAVFPSLSKTSFRRKRP